MAISAVAAATAGAAPVAGPAPSPPAATATAVAPGTGQPAGDQGLGVASPLAEGAVSTGEPARPVPMSDAPPPGRRLSPARVFAIAARQPGVGGTRLRHAGSYGYVYLKPNGRWQVSFFGRSGREVAQVIVGDGRGRALETWVGFQAAWTMARGYRGAFGGHVNALYVWIPLCLLFFLPFFDWRRPFRLLHLDLLVLLSFSVSLAFFNHAEIYASVPLVYPPLIYLLARTLGIALRRRSQPRGPRVPLVPHVPVAWLALGVVFLIGFRVALNVVDSNVIDVGYASVVGAQKVSHGAPLYGGWPREIEHGDTYGPVSYEAYVPFVALAGFSGHWDDLPAAHTAAVVFDLLAVALLFLLGRRVRDSELGLLLAYGWVSYPFTLFALESNSNDTLVGVLVLATLLVAASPAARGAMAALAGLTKLAPLVLVPLLASHGLRAGPDSRAASRQPPAGGARARAASDLALFAGAFLLVAGLALIPALTHDSLGELYARTVTYQGSRNSPFSIWDLHPTWHWLQLPVELGAVALALVLALVPRRDDLIGLAAGCAALLIALQLGLEYWFYLYIPWFFGLVLLAILGVAAGAGGSSDGHGSRSGSIESAERAREERISTPISQGSSVAVSKRVGIWLRKPSTAWVRSTPITPPRAPVMPTSVM